MSFLCNNVILIVVTVTFVITTIIICKKYLKFTVNSIKKDIVDNSIKKDVNDIDNKPEILENDTISIKETLDTESNLNKAFQEMPYKKTKYK